MMFKIKAIVSDIYDDDAISTETVLVLQIINKSCLTKIINFLNIKLPMNKLSLNHLKRINSKTKTCQILICPIKDFSMNLEKEEENGDIDDYKIIQKTINQMDNDLKQFLTEFGLENLKLCQVPISAPLTRNQLQRTNILWPISFHENKHIAGCLDGSVFSQDRLKRINQLMKETLDLLENSNQCSVMITKNDGEQIVTKARNDTDHPLHHAIIVAIGNVAEIHSKYKSNINNLQQSDLIDQYKDDYLCTNYECFISQEPCIMCAMALVHSRIKRVFFYSSSSSSDENSFNDNNCDDHCFTIHKLHVNSNLNHRYEVWQLSLNSNDDSNTKQIFPNKKLKS